MAVTAQTVEIIYNDKFDVEHHPIQQWHREHVATVANHFKFGEDKKWYYHATIHGGIFWLKDKIRPDMQPRRLHADDLRMLLALPGFRWVELIDDTVQFGLSHVLPPA